ncbi:MAG: hypothetical protein ACI8S3_002771 [Alphaproteobacteria bacterium]|jgi:hypothetical protein
MQINNHFSPTSLGHGSRPDQAANAQGRGQQFQPAAEVEPAAATDTTNAVAAAEEAEETAGPGKSGQSPAHEARSLAALHGNYNFGWLVSQIARGDTPTAATDVVEETNSAEDPAPIGDEELPADETAEAGTTPDPVVEDPVASLLSDIIEETTTPPADETTDLVEELVGTLLDETEDDAEVT